MNISHVNKTVFSKNKVWLLSGIILAILIAQFITSSNFLYLAAIFVLPFIIYVSIKITFIFPFGFYVLLIPFDEVLILTGGSTGPTLTKLLGVLTILILFLKGLFEKKFRKPDRLVLWWILFILYCIFSLLWAISPSHTLSRIPTAVGLFILYLVVSTYKVQKNEYEILKWFVLAGGILASLFAIYNFRTVAVIGRTSLTLGDHMASLNSFAFGLLIPVSFCIEKMLYQKRLLFKIILGIFLGSIAFCIVITGSRGAMLGIAIILVVYYFSIRNKIALSMLLIIIGIILFSFIPSFFIERWEGALESGGAGRTIIWQIGLLSLQKYFLIGSGLNNFPLAYNEFMDQFRVYKGVGRAPHNIYLGFLVELGVIGFSFMAMSIWQHYRATTDRLFYKSINQVMLKAALSGVLVSSFFLDTVWLKSFWLIFMMITMHKYIQIQEADDNEIYSLFKRYIFKNN